MSNALSTVARCEEEDLFDQYRSRPKQLARWLLESRDTLRAKYQKLKADCKRLTVRVNDVSRSRDNWKQRAEVSDNKCRRCKRKSSDSPLCSSKEPTLTKKKLTAPPTSLIPISPGSSTLEPPADLTPAQSPVCILPPGPPIGRTERVPRQSFSFIHDRLFSAARVLQCCSSMSAVPKTLAFFFPEQARQGYIPHPTAGRLWLLRLGYYKLHTPLEQADDWIWLADHAVEIGKASIPGDHWNSLS